MEMLLDDSVELFWLKIGVEIEEEDTLLELIESQLGKPRDPGVI